MAPVMRGLDTPAARCRGRVMRPVAHAIANAAPRTAKRQCGRSRLWQGCIMDRHPRAHQIGSHTQASRSGGMENPSKSWTIWGSKLPNGLGAEAIEMTTWVGRGDILPTRGST